jgi:DNA primase
LPPAGLCNLDRGKDYLKSRGFVPEAIIQEYGLIITGPIGDYKFRIIIPIYQHGKLVSYQGRDYTGLSPIRYKACARENEIVHHKHLLYDADGVTGDHVIVVEGIFDAWKMKKNTVCTFGTGFTQQQVNLLSKWGKVSILYDGEPEAQKHAEKLGEQLSGLGTDVENIRLGKEDPGALSMEEAGALSKEILGE